MGEEGEGRSVGPPFHNCYDSPFRMTISAVGRYSIKAWKIPKSESDSAKDPLKSIAATPTSIAATNATSS